VEAAIAVSERLAVGDMGEGSGVLVMIKIKNGENSEIYI
jgi:hypothetical protein